MWLCVPLCDTTPVILVKAHNGSWVKGSTNSDTCDLLTNQPETCIKYNVAYRGTMWYTADDHQIRALLCEEYDVIWNRIQYAFSATEIFYCLSNAMHDIGQIYNHLSVCLSVCLSVSLSVCLSVCPKYLSLSIATAVFVRSSSNLKCRSHIWQRRVSSMATNTESSQRACASIYFRLTHFWACAHDSALTCRQILVKFGM